MCLCVYVSTGVPQRCSIIFATPLVCMPDKAPPHFGGDGHLFAKIKLWVHTLYNLLSNLHKCKLIWSIEGMANYENVRLAGVVMGDVF